MPNDQPIAYTAEGRPLFDNTPTVVCVIVEDAKGRVLAVRRANEPGRGLLGLPGGYHMRGESWQEAGAREVKEETGVELLADEICLTNLVTDEYGNNLVIARYRGLVRGEDARPVDGEASEIVWISYANLRPEEWAFPRHLRAVMDYLTIHAIHPR
ncbi:NUDIX domain-containing protein [Paracoccus litorisediminis]|nr:NUDIX hydrolase [Paracoccus litorisediminis]